MDPVAAFQRSRSDTVEKVLPYYLLLLLINAGITALFFALIIGSSPVTGLVAAGVPGPVLIFLLILAGGFIATLVFGAWLHLWVYLFGGRKGIWQTLKAVLYGSTPYLLFGWIPVLGFLFTLWTLVLGIFGIRELQEISPLKAVLAVALAVMLPLILLLALAAYFLVASVTPTGPVSVIGQP